MTDPHPPHADDDEQPYNRGGLAPRVQVVPAAGLIGERIYTPDGRVFELTAKGLAYRGYIALPPELDGDSP